MPQKKLLAYLWRDVLCNVVEPNREPCRKEKHAAYVLPQQPKIWRTLNNELINFTPREVQMLEWLNKDKSYREIGHALGLSYRTVEFYVKNIRAKLNIADKDELVRFMRHHQLLNKLRAE